MSQEHQPTLDTTTTESNEESLELPTTPPVAVQEGGDCEIGESACGAKRSHEEAQDENETKTPVGEKEGDEPAKKKRCCAQDEEEEEKKEDGDGKNTPKDDLAEEDTQPSEEGSDSVPPQEATGDAESASQS
jgi:hypothetical protein